MATTVLSQMCSINHHLASQLDSRQISILSTHEITYIFHQKWKSIFSCFITFFNKWSKNSTDCERYLFILNKLGKLIIFDHLWHKPANICLIMFSFLFFLNLFPTMIIGRDKIDWSKQIQKSLIVNIHICIYGASGYVEEGSMLC